MSLIFKVLTIISISYDNIAHNKCFLRSGNMMTVMARKMSSATKNIAALKEYSAAAALTQHCLRMKPREECAVAYGCGNYSLSKLAHVTVH